MKASFVDLRKRSAEIIRALERNERVTVLYRGRPKAVMYPLAVEGVEEAPRAGDHAAFGMWAGRKDLKGVATVPISKGGKRSRR